jgi:uncharacterized membrane-anchored protein YitT (DUF2179 family)
MANFGGIDIAIITAVIALISSAFASIMTYIFNRKLTEANNKYQKGLEELKNQLATKNQNKMHDETLNMKLGNISTKFVSLFYFK